MTQYAIITGMIATIHEGKRLVKYYHAGDPLVGYIPEEKPSKAFADELQGKWQAGHKARDYKGN